MIKKIIIKIFLIKTKLINCLLVFLKNVLNMVLNVLKIVLNVLKIVLNLLKIVLNFLIQIFYRLIPIVIKCLKLLHKILLSYYFKKIIELFALLYIMTQIIIITATIASIAVLFFPQPEVVELLKMLSFITDDALRVVTDTFIIIKEFYIKLVTRTDNALRVVTDTFIIIKEFYIRIVTTITNTLHIIIEVYTKIVTTVADALHVIREVYIEITTAIGDTLDIIKKSFQNLRATLIKLPTIFETLERYEIEHEKNLLEIDSLKRALEIKERENAVLKAAVWNQSFF